MHLLREEEGKVKASRGIKSPKLSLSRFVSADGGEGGCGDGLTTADFLHGM
jgi:hypothetical protein